MKRKQATTMMTLVLAIVAMAFLATPAVAEDDHAYRIAPPGSHAYGKTLTDWLSVYWRWYYGSGADPAQSFIGHVKLMPLPAGEYISGAGTPDDPALYRGHLEITLRPGTPFVLPLAAWTVERYNNGNPDDPSIPDADFLAGVSPSLYIDGRSVVSDSNKAAFYVPLTAFDPIVIYPAPTSYNSYAVVIPGPRYREPAAVRGKACDPSLRAVHYSKRPPIQRADLRQHLDRDGQAALIGQ